jgi:predicted Rossmann fold nucleotide-binding protein DprA/Smf involved in DNA uptake
MDIAAVSAELLTLELQGDIEMLPGGMVRRLATP